MEQPRLVAFELRRGRYHRVADVGGDEEFEAVRPYRLRTVPAALVADSWSS